MIVYRICKAQFSGLDGEGARLWGGRWNSSGRPMLYTTASPSLAVLEVLVHLDLPSELFPSDYKILTIELPDDLGISTFTGNADDSDVSQRAGDAFLAAGQFVAMRVPSVIVPQEWNLLFNPLHHDMSWVTVRTSDPFTFDPRLKK